ncbi:MAG: hypothetical protein IKK34_08350 [Clostridia bacterium]|nr:hypothetical protein [Clostridia bacterium]
MIDAQIRGIPKIEFDEESHVYMLGGMKLPSVTQIMEPMSLMLYSDVPEDALQNAADRGTRAHEQVSNFVKYGIVESDEDTQPYVEAFIRFQEEHHPVWVASELRIFHRLMSYAGTLDLLGYIEPDDGTGVDVIDIKCTAVYHPVMLATQIGGYSEALKSHGIKVRQRYGLQLLKNGKYRFERVGDGYKNFLHCLAIYNAMQGEKRA